MDYLSSIVKGVTKFASGLNPATLSGAIDILLIQQQDGTFQSSPFYVRFGKIGVASCAGKEVDVEINGEEIDLVEAINVSMKLDDYGVAHFIDTKECDTTEVPHIRIDESIEDVHEVFKPKSEDKATVTVPEKMRKIDTLDTEEVFKKFRNLERRISFDPSGESEECFPGKQECPELGDSIQSSASSPSKESSQSTGDKVGHIPLATPSIDTNIDASLQAVDTSLQAVENSPEENVTLRKNTLNLTPAELDILNLVKGYNEVTFSITTQYQGTTRCTCNVFVWHYKDKIVISDIDGTITKSDVRGMFLPMIAGFKWAQGDVTRLYNRISQNGYHMAYLSARAIGQAGATKEYINWLKQDDLYLPKGPLFLNPKSLMRTFNQEVITRTPEVFKIECLQHILQCFDGNNPFYAGYGNRPNDVVAYKEVGIPMSRIFIINKSGSVQGGIHLNQTSYKDQSLVVDHIFPPLDGTEVHDDPNMNSYMFWKLPLPDVDLQAF